MGLLNKLAVGRPSTTVKLTGGRVVHAVGEMQYQKALERICGGRCEDGWQMPVTAHLLREPKNKYDANAVRVMVGEALVGYLSRDDAKRYAPALDKLGKRMLVACDGEIRGGWRRKAGMLKWDEGKFGIVLKLPAPEKIAEQALDG